MIAKANFKDISELNTLINSAYRGETSKIGWTTEANILEGIRTSEKELLQIIKEPNSTIFKFVDDQIIIGCVLLEIKTEKLYLGMLTVCPELQDSGIGKKLLKFADNYAIDLGLSKIIMTVISVRKELIDWYMRHGYQDTGIKEPFPMANPEYKPKQKLEFIVLEKLIL